MWAPSWKPRGKIASHDAVPSNLQDLDTTDKNILCMCAILSSLRLTQVALLALVVES
jgi:hypothetical protein